MEGNIIIYILIALIVVAVVGFLVKSFMKVVLVLALIYLLFQLGFLWGVDDLNEKLHLNKILKPEVNEQIQEGYKNFAEKREEMGVVDTKEVDKIIDTTIQKTLENASNKVQNVDKDQLIRDLGEKLKDFDIDTVEKALQHFGSELAKNNITPTDVENANK